MGFFSKLADWLSDEEKQYDEQGRLVRIIQYYSTGTLSQMTEYNPENGNKIKYTEYKHYFITTKGSYKVRETIYYPDGCTKHFVIEFKDDMPIKEVIYNENSNIKAVKNF